MPSLPPNERQGNRPSASRYNQHLAHSKWLAGQIAELRAQLRQLQSHDIPQIRPVQLSEAIGPESADDFRNREGAIQYFDNTSQVFSTTGLTLENIASLDGLPADAGDRFPCIYHKGVNYPLSSRNVRHAITCRTDSNTYPASHTNPNVYPIKFVRLSYTKTAGAQSVTVGNLASVGGPDEVVLNIFSGPSNYIPEGSLIQVYALVLTDGSVRWYCHQSAQEDESGSGSGDGDDVVQIDAVDTHCYAVRNSSSSPSITDGTHQVILLDTQVHRYPNNNTVFVLSSGQVTVKRAGVYRFSYKFNGEWQTGDEMMLRTAIEENGTVIKGSEGTCIVGGNGTDTHDSSEASFEHVVASNSVYRLVSWIEWRPGSEQGQPSASAFGYCRMDICKVRSV